jgi:hypothetical protein
VRLLLATDGFASRPDLLATATLRSMTQPSAVNASYAKGWMVNGGNWWHTGCLDGTATEMVRTAQGYTWVILLNTNNNSARFWAELDALGWQWLAGAKSWPMHDLFAPAQAATDLWASAQQGGQTQLTWVAGTGTHRLVLLKADAPGTAFPVDGTAYPAPSLLADGTLVVANEESNSAWLPPLDTKRTYYARVVDYRQDTVTGNHPVYMLEGNPVVVLGPGNGTQQLATLVRAQKPTREVVPMGGALSLPHQAYTPEGALAPQAALLPMHPMPMQLPPTYVQDAD